VQLLVSQEGLIQSGNCQFGVHKVECLDFKIKSGYLELYDKREQIHFPNKTDEKQINCLFIMHKISGVLK